MSKVLVISGHPDLQSSITNKVILNELTNSIKAIEIRELDKLYPDYQLDIAQEQKSLISADIIVLQFPFYWYSIPALLKKWIDDVFHYGFAYGSNGDKLKGKKLILSFTIGGPQESYDALGYNHFPIEELIKPLQQTAFLTGMDYQKPIYSHGMVYIEGVYNTQELVEHRADEHSRTLINKINNLLNSPTNEIKRFINQWFKSFDLLPFDDTIFLKHLSQDINWNMPEGYFEGHHGFKEWYHLIKQKFSACDHAIEQVKIHNNNAYDYIVDFNINLTATNHNNEAIYIKVKEKWQLSMINNHILISDYKVTEI